MYDTLSEIEQYTNSDILILALSALLAGLVAYFASPIIMRYVLKYLSTKNIDFNRDRFIYNSRWALLVTFISYPVVIAIENINIPYSFGGLLESLVLSLVVVLWLRVLQNVGRYGIKTVVSHRYDDSIIPIIQNVWTLLILVIGMFSLFNVWNIDITPLLASAGIAGVVLGLAARETISNFFGSIALYADKAYEKGDFIEVSSGEFAGYVTDISIRSTQLTTLRGNKVIVPNSKLHNSIIENRSVPEDEYRVDLKVSISYGDDPQAAERAIRSAIEDIINSEEGYRNTWFFGGTDNYKLFLEEFGDSAVEFKAFVKVRRPEDEPRIKSRFYRKIYSELENEDIKIPYPQRSLHIKNHGKDAEPEFSDTGQERNQDKS